MTCFHHVFNLTITCVYKVTNFIFIFLKNMSCRHIFLIILGTAMTPLLLLPHTDKSHSAPFSSENGAQGGDSDAWQCTPPQSTSPSGETPAHPPPSQPGSRPCSRPASPSPPSALTGTKKRRTKPAHMRRNIRYFNLTSVHPENTFKIITEVTIHFYYYVYYYISIISILRVKLLFKFQMYF